VRTPSSSAPKGSDNSAQGNALGKESKRIKALKDLIDNIGSITSAQVDAVTTLPAGDAATVDASITGGVLHFSFGIPQGQMGDPGPTGGNGNDGAPGQPFAQAVVDNVNTVSPRQDATVDVSFDGTNVHFSFGIPCGNDGSQGKDGAQGPPGEVTLDQLANVINGSSANSNSVGTLGLGVNDPSQILSGF
jgi:hypothetical protein